MDKERRRGGRRHFLALVFSLPVASWSTNPLSLLIDRCHCYFWGPFYNESRIIRVRGFRGFLIDSLLLCAWLVCAVVRESERRNRQRSGDERAGRKENRSEFDQMIKLWRRLHCEMRIRTAEDAMEKVEEREKGN